MWAIRSAFGANGDLVECGVFKGFYTGVAVDYLDLDRSGVGNIDTEKLSGCTGVRVMPCAQGGEFTPSHKIFHPLAS